MENNIEHNALHWAVNGQSDVSGPRVEP